MFEAVGWIINNDSMNIVKDTLVQIHQQFYARAQQQQQQQQQQPQKSTGELSMSVGEIIGQLRALARSEGAVSLLSCQADGWKVPLSIDVDS